MRVAAILGSTPNGLGLRIDKRIGLEMCFQLDLEMNQLEMYLEHWICSELGYQFEWLEWRLERQLELPRTSWNTLLC